MSELTPVQVFDKIIDVFSRASAALQLRDKIDEARDTGRKQCGNCERWMKSSQCPRERNVNGYSRGPSMSEPACSKFEITDSAVALRKQRDGEVVAFALRHGLPVPAGFER
jgi:hypothetical protein